MSLGGLKVLERYFKILDEYRNSITDYIVEKDILENANELNLKFPESMIEFYIHFGNDEEMLSSFHYFYNLQEIMIAKDALIFAEKHEEIGKLAIQLENLGTNHEKVSLFEFSEGIWYVEEKRTDTFFLNMAAWQILNTMYTLTETSVSKEEFDELIGDDLKYICEDEWLMSGAIIPVYGKGILGCYVVDSEILYLGTKTDETMEEYEEILEMEFDWL